MTRDPFDFSSSRPTAASPEPNPAPTISAWEDALRMRFALLATPPADAAAALSPEGEGLLADILSALEQGLIRAAHPPQNGSTAWQPNAWLKTALVQLAAASPVIAQPGPLPGSERRSLSWLESRPPIHRIPAGSHIRRGVFLSPGTLIMPASVIQTGVWLGTGVRVDSHTLIGSCTQIADDVAIGPGTILAGLLLPAETLPVILEPGVTLMGQNGIYGSVHVGAGCLFRPGTIVEQSLGVYDAASNRWITSETTLHIRPASELAMGIAPAISGSNDPPRLTAVILRRESMS